MRVAVVGLGRMGLEVLTVLRERGHEAVPVRRGEAFPGGCAAGIDFTRAEAVLPNLGAALAAGAAYVVGTTGWESQLEEARAAVAGSPLGLVHAANFSLGVSLYYRVVRDAARLMARFPDYDPYVLERHHRLKRDAPSGTARELARLVEQAGGLRRRAVSSLDGALPPDAFHVSAVRAGGIVGEHTVGFDSGGDEILLEHRARTRRGFALGAVLAAEWLPGRRGVFPFEAVLAELLAH